MSGGNWSLYKSYEEFYSGFFPGQYFWWSLEWPQQPLEDKNLWDSNGNINNSENQMQKKKGYSFFFFRAAAAPDSARPTTLCGSTPSRWEYAAHTLLLHSTSQEWVVISLSPWVTLPLFTSCMNLQSQPFFSFRDTRKRMTNEIIWLVRLETAAETRHQTDFVFILPR